MPRRTTTSGDFTVARDDRSMPTAGAAFSRAQHLAMKADGEIQLGVFENGTQIGRVVRNEDGSIDTITITRRDG